MRLLVIYNLQIFSTAIRWVNDALIRFLLLSTDSSAQDHLCLLTQVYIRKLADHVLASVKLDNDPGPKNLLKSNKILILIKTNNIYNAQRRYYTIVTRCSTIYHTYYVTRTHTITTIPQRFVCDSNRLITTTTRICLENSRRPTTVLR